jgi:hypothetical protein
MTGGHESSYIHHDKHTSERMNVPEGRVSLARRILRLTALLLSCSVSLPQTGNAGETQQMVDSVSDEYQTSETDDEIVVYYHHVTINRERIIAFVSVVLVAVLTAVAAILFARGRRPDSSQDDRDR